MEQLVSLLREVVRPLSLGIIICIFTYVLREYLKEKRERKRGFHAV